VDDDRHAADFDSEYPLLDQGRCNDTNGYHSHFQGASKWLSRPLAVMSPHDLTERQHRHSWTSLADIAQR
jgi:hypothetical protein